MMIPPGSSPGILNPEELAWPGRVHETLGTESYGVEEKGTSETWD